jgi:hypothetical protein
MPYAPYIAERQGQVLAELAELGLGIARRLAARAEAAESDADAQALALAFHRVSRSVRLTLALEVRLQRERLQGAREARKETARAAQTRKEQVRHALGRAMSAETEADETERLWDVLEERLDEAGLYEDFVAGPVEACIARIRADLGLPPADPADDPGPFASAATGPPRPHTMIAAHPT